MTKEENRNLDPDSARDSCSRNSPLGGQLICGILGQPTPAGRKLQQIINKATYTPNWQSNEVQDLVITTHDNTTHSFSSLAELKDFAENESREADEYGSRNRRKNLQQDASLRSQHILDPSQERARRSHLYDGIPIIIEGGPGTGKTTTVIQRLNFLLDAKNLKQSITSDNNSNKITNKIGDLLENDLSNKWLFFEPSSLLLQYLRNNMQGEGLNPNEKNTCTITDFRSNMFQEYGISSTQPKFKVFEDESTPFILAPKRTIEYFENYCVATIEKKREQVSTFKFDSNVTNRIQSFCRNFKVKDFTSLLEFLHLLHVVYEEVKKETKNEGILNSVKKQFPDFFSGVEKAFLEKIPEIYSNFRRQNNEDCLYNRNLYSIIVCSDNYDYFHAEEQDLLLGFINETIIRICTKDPNRLNKLNGRFASAYKKFCRPIIVIDEATDYSLLDFYCIKSFRHYALSSITLSGDLMQGTLTQGIQSWDELSEIFPKREKYTLKTSYRQTPTLIEMAKKLYQDSLGEEAAYNSSDRKGENEAKPQLLISNDESEKANWIAEQIESIYFEQGYLPSTAIFIGDYCNGSDFAKSITDTGKLYDINVVYSEDPRDLAARNTVRVFRLSKIKGMEFDSVFFYDIDKSVQNQSNDLMRRMLYVGVSRAANYLAATMSSSNESIAKYFEP